ncbi:MAG: hypothetical protein Q4D21_06205 [Phascolarctobacterium sp.]|nr:hypothetical protein [Phascolarctobacterium sp.]
MVTYKYFKTVADMIHYHYKTNGMGNDGEFAISIDGKRVKFIKNADFDEARNHVCHALNKIATSLRNGEPIPLEGTIAWY